MAGNLCSCLGLHQSWFLPAKVVGSQPKAQCTCLDSGTLDMLGVRVLSPGIAFGWLLERSWNSFYGKHTRLLALSFPNLWNSPSLMIPQQNKEAMHLQKKVTPIFSFPTQFRFKGMPGNLGFIKDCNSGSLCSRLTSFPLSSLGTSFLAWVFPVGHGEVRGRGVVPR